MAVPAADAVRRADAQRNRGLLLEAAAQAFAEGGIDVTAGEIARRAGVAKGTLFRHFPAKSDLVAAVLIDRLAQLRLLIGEVTQARAAGLDAVAEIMRRGAEVLAADRSFFDGAMAHVERDSSLRREKLALEAALDGLVAAAQAAGEVRGDVSGIDVAMLMMAATNTCAPTQDVYPDLWRRYLALMIDSLRPGEVTPLPVAPLNGAAMLASAGADACRPA